MEWGGGSLCPNVIKSTSQRCKKGCEKVHLLIGDAGKWPLSMKVHISRGNVAKCACFPIFQKKIILIIAPQAYPCEQNQPIFA